MNEKTLKTKKQWNQKKRWVMKAELRYPEKVVDGVSYYKRSQTIKIPDKKREAQ